jgi:hypothetical protein
VDNKILLTVVLVLFTVAAALVVFAPGEQDTQAVSTAAAPSQTQGATSTAVVSTPHDVQASIASGVDEAGVSQTASDIASGATPPSSLRVIATYFHNTARCVTCRSIEQRSRDTIQTAFAAEIASGRLVWRTLNMEEKENEHYAIDYGLPYASLVLAEMDGEREVRFKVLDQTWDLVHKKQPLLEDYVENETRAFLEGR